MNLYDKIKSPFEDLETIRAIIKNLSDNNVLSSGDMYHSIVRNNNEAIDNSSYMDCFDENIYWPFLENDWKRNEEKESKRPEFKKIYDRFSSYQELYNYINSLDKETKEALERHKAYSKGENPDTQLVNKYKTILQGRTSNVRELLAAYDLYEKFPKLHEFHSQDLMGFHFDSKKHDGTVNKENAEIKFFINAGEDTFRVAKLFLDKCREAKVDSYYFKVVDPMHGEQVRDDKLCIYSSIEHSKTFLEFLTEIQKENPDITFRKPPLTAGTIDNFIGVGTDTLENNRSYNTTISEVVYEVLNAIAIEKHIKKRELYSYVEKNPTVLNIIKERLIQGCITKGCSKDKICVSDKLAERLKTVEITDTTEKAEDIEQNKKDSSQVRKGPIQVYDERGNIIIQDYINPELMKRKIVLPNGNQINARQYIQEFVVPHIPESGTFKLKNGNEISARQYIEEFIMFELEKYNGDIHALMQDTLAGTDEPPERDGWTQPTHGQEMGISEEQAENLSSNPRVSLESLKKVIASKRDRERVGLSEVKESQDEIALRQERGKLVSLSMRGQLDEDGKRRLEEINSMLGIQGPQRSADKGQKNSQYTGQNR